jgi:hypothetical protein
LQQYQREFPKGELRVDAEVLAIEALAGAGRTAEAQRRAQQFLSQRPADPHVARVRWLVREVERRNRE